jgi:hypothetical protein
VKVRAFFNANSSHPVSSVGVMEAAAQDSEVSRVAYRRSPVYRYVGHLLWWLADK